MIEIRSGQDRGSARLDWLQSYHTFSFGHYYDPRHMSFGPLRVINEDFIQPGQGFGTHGHRDMEIITYVLEGALEHQDSLGNGSIIQPGDIQRMTAGTGIQHSEYNPSQSDPVHLLQIWIVPDREGLEPDYEQTHVALEQQKNRLHLLGSKTSQRGAVTIHQDIDLYAAQLSQQGSVTHTLPAQRMAWLHVAKGAVQINEVYALVAGDAAAITNLRDISIDSQSEDAEILLFDMVA
ncbi:pirin family protein [Acaryochloris sp. IP29b_bin.137]|uniref:pirin family protein n=1 Tax=Acaryochloris sp. IP29b_bin.137 TaxID=2969217 RepID=UPI00262CD804|nr:pirin family protein [Acaryochloris sp. IP29b_bin.137]